PIDASLYPLRAGNVEAAVVPACLLEQMLSEGLLQPSNYRVLNQQPNERSLCAVSTPLYPNWSFAKTERGSAQIAKQIAQVLLAMPPEHPAVIAAGASGWTSPVSLLSIDKLYQALDLHPLQQPWWSEALRWLRSHQEWAWALFMFVIVLNAYHFWLEYRFSKSKQALEQTSLRLKEKSEQLEHSQRVAIVGEIGTSLAHELNQPLAAIRNYSEGGLLRLAKKRPHEDIVPVL
ncbi:PhnD/SsuA/transferrin family substrate-binding protein, partial [Vibrio parahaemolyticus]|nr:PhnD/SsuA/transferrin family substrate-binding protein [Vibrio parahaemolyticus]